MTNPFSDVKKFNRAAGNAGGCGVGAVNWRLLRQAIDHVAEEAREMAVASDNLEQRIALSESTRESAEAFADVADAAIDLIYVSVNVLYALGFNYEKMWEEVHIANMQKLPQCEACFGGGVMYDPGLKAITCRTCGGHGRTAPIRNEAGKIMKPEGWQPPDLASIIERELKL